MGPSIRYPEIPIDLSLVSVIQTLQPNYIRRHESSWFEKLSPGRDNRLLPSSRLTRSPGGRF